MREAPYQASWLCIKFLGCARQGSECCSKPFALMEPHGVGGGEMHVKSTNTALKVIVREGTRQESAGAGQPGDASSSAASGTGRGCTSSTLC